MQETIEQTSETHNSKEYSVTIDLSKSRSAKSYDTDNIIQKEALKEVEGHIESILGSVKEYKEETENITPEFDYYPREHNTITISGSRGSGKTSFILSVMNLISDPKNKFKGDNTREHFKESNDKLSVLGLVDPTIVSTKEHILVNVIARIKKKVTEEYKKQHKKRQDDYDTWKKSLIDLSGGLVQLESVGSNSGLKHNGWDDPMLVMGEGLTNATEGFKLEFLLHEFIKQSLKFLDKTAFVIAFDDIDTKFNSGWPVLETIRMYLTTPHLIVMLSGDLELFTTLIRNEQWKLFDEKCLENDKMETKKGRINFNAQVEELEAQYLLKILPPHSRVHLKSIKEISSDICINDKSKSLDQYVKNMITNVFYYKSGSNINSVKELLFNLPVRTILQVLIAYNESYSSEQNKTLGEEFNNKLVSIFISNLYNQGYKNSELHIINSSLKFNALSIKLLDDDKIRDSYKLRPDTVSEEQNILYLVLSRLYTSNNNRNSIADMIDFWIKVCISREFSLKGLKEKEKKTWVENKKFIDSISLDNEKNPIQVFSKYLALTQSTGIENDSNKWIYPEAFRVSRKAGKKIPAREAEARIRIDHTCKELQIEELTKNNDIAFVNAVSDKCLLNNNLSLYELPFISALDRAGNRTFASFFNVLCFLYEILTEEKINNEIIDKKLSKWSGIRAYPMPFQTNDDYELDETSETLGDKSSNNKNDILTNLVQWTSHLRNVDSPISLWANIWARCYYSLINFSGAREIRNFGVGDFMHQQIVIFFNSILVEEYLYNNDGRNSVEKNAIYLKNPRSTESQFINNITKFYVETTNSYSQILFDKAPLFSFLFSCPLWGYYLNPKSETMKYHKLIMGALHISDTDYTCSIKGDKREINLFYLLNTLVPAKQLSVANEIEMFREIFKDYQESAIDIISSYKTNFGMIKFNNDELDLCLKDNFFVNRVKLYKSTMPKINTTKYKEMKTELIAFIDSNKDLINNAIALKNSLNLTSDFIESFNNNELSFDQFDNMSDIWEIFKAKNKSNKFFEDYINEYYSVFVKEILSDFLSLNKCTSLVKYKETVSKRFKISLLHENDTLKSDEWVSDIVTSIWNMKK